MSVSESVIDSFRSGDSYCISEFCKLVYMFVFTNIEESVVCEEFVSSGAIIQRSAGANKQLSLEFGSFSTISLLKILSLVIFYPAIISLWFCLQCCICLVCKTNRARLVGLEISFCALQSRDAVDRVDVSDAIWHGIGSETSDILSSERHLTTSDTVWKHRDISVVRCAL